jgi:2,3-bisphosphoglycerate-independent phosphoglycerate mutase
MTSSKVILAILDGWGIGQNYKGNAILKANPETFNFLSSHYPSAKLTASGPSVGLPENEDGNSETGHLNLGAGRIVFQDLARINMSIADGSFFTNPVLLKTIEHVQKNQSRLHLLGLVGNSGVHSYNDHLYALLLLSAKHNLKNVFLHLITDGRDSPPTDSPNQIKKIQDQISHYQTGQITSIMGRYYAMDRDMRLDRTKIAFDCLIGNTKENYSDPITAINTSYQNNITDEFIVPTTIGNNPENTRLKENDALIFFNFRIDRPRQLTKSIIDAQIKNFAFTTMTKYHEHFNLPTAFPMIQIKNTLAETISKQNLRQLHSSESEKERFVTFYFNGQNEEPFKGEDRLIVASPKVATYDLQPEMSSKELTDIFINRYKTENYAFSVINYANPDMVAHTGNVEKTALGITAVDQALNRLSHLAKETASYLLITADHGNAEELTDPITEKVNTEHSSSPVPVILYHHSLPPNIKLRDGILADIAPTILHLLQINKPLDMSGNSLLQYLPR